MDYGYEEIKLGMGFPCSQSDLSSEMEKLSKTLTKEQIDKVQEIPNKVDHHCF